MKPSLIVVIIVIVQVVVDVRHNGEDVHGGCQEGHLSNTYGRSVCCSGTPERKRWGQEGPDNLSTWHLSSLPVADTWRLLPPPTGLASSLSWLQPPVNVSPEQLAGETSAGSETVRSERAEGWDTGAGLSSCCPAVQCSLLLSSRVTVRSPGRHQTNVVLTRQLDIFLSLQFFLI